MLRQLIVLLFCLLPAGRAMARDCSIDHVTRRFGVRAERGVIYGADVLFNGGIDSLRMNIFKPVGDGQTQRPVLIAVHGGDWIGGDRTEMDSLCVWYAQRGYVAVTINYRMGFYGAWPLDPPYAYDPQEVVRACYRASQDLNGAIRFMKGRAAPDSSSTAHVVIWGASAGAITSLQAVYAADPGEKPAVCGAIDPAWAFLTPYVRPDLGPQEGRLNLNGQDARVEAVAAAFGGVFDTTYVDSAADPALYLYHQTGDPVVGCGDQQGLWGLPLGVGANYPWIHGSCSLDQRMRHLGFDAARYEFYLHEGPDHAVHDIALMDSLIAVFLARQICPGGSTTVGPARPPASAIHAYPNPAGGILSLSWVGEPVTRLRLYDVAGRLVRDAAVAPGAGALQIPVDRLANGVYLVRCERPGSSSTMRVVVAH